MNIDLDKLSFPANDPEAKERYADFEHWDPFPDIPPALLNSADISKYVRVTGMVHPFDGNQDKGKLKSASYEIDFLGEVYLWEEGKKDFTNKKIIPNKPFEIPKNSIVFVSTETVFRLPDYIALRFNLRIKHVHRGLLLGTGPLVDPGFAGQLFIPLHNLTSESYSIKGGEGLIWVEFTKISPHRHWVDKEEDCGEYVHFNPKARYLTPQDYLNKTSDKGKPARSSIPQEVAEAKSLSEKAYRRLKVLTVGGVVALIISVVSVILPVIGLVQDSATNLANVIKDAALTKEAVAAQEATISSLQQKITALETRLQSRSTDKATKTTVTQPEKANINSKVSPDNQNGHR